MFGSDGKTTDLQSRTPYSPDLNAKLSGNSVVYLICSMANADDTLAISTREPMRGDSSVEVSSTSALHIQTNRAACGESRLPLIVTLRVSISEAISKLGGKMRLEVHN